MPSHKHTINKIPNYLLKDNQLPLECVGYGEINTVKKIIKLGYTRMNYDTDRPMRGTNWSLYQYLMSDYNKHSKRQRLKMYHLLIHHGLDTEKPWREFYMNLDPKNNLIYKIWKKLFKQKCFDICIALQPLELPALQTVAI